MEHNFNTSSVSPHWTAEDGPRLRPSDLCQIKDNGHVIVLKEFVWRLVDEGESNICVIMIHDLFA